jgi:hypothetical protein
MIHIFLYFSFSVDRVFLWNNFMKIQTEMSLCCLHCFDLRILITLLVLSNSSISCHDHKRKMVHVINSSSNLGIHVHFYFHIFHLKMKIYKKYYYYFWMKSKFNRLWYMYFFIFLFESIASFSGITWWKFRLKLYIIYICTFIDRICLYNHEVSFPLFPS